MESASVPVAPADDPRATGHTVTVEDLWAHHGQSTILRGVDLTLTPGQVTALIGPSGSGKTTLLRCVNRMHEEIARARVSGTIRLDGEDVYGPGVDVPTVRRLIGMVFQTATPFPTMSVLDDVGTGLRLAGVRGSELRDRVEEALRAVGLWAEVRDRLGEPGAGLSEGQQQRLCIARALAAAPDVLLLDEPCTALDPIATLRVEELIARLRSRYTIALVTHNMQQAARVADTTAFLSDGELVEHAPTSVLFTRPRDERTERFLTGKFN